MDVIARVAVDVGWLLIVFMSFWYLITFGLNIFDAMGVLIGKYFHDFLLQVGFAGSTTMIAFPFMGALAGALIAKGLDEVVTDFGDPEKPPYGWLWVLAAIALLFGGPIMSMRSQQKRESLVVPGRIHDLRLNYSDAERAGILASIGRDRARVNKKLGKLYGRAFKAQLGLSIVALSVAAFRAYGFPEVGTRPLLQFGTYFLVAMAARVPLRRWSLRAEIKRIDEYEALTRAQTRPRASEKVPHHRHVGGWSVLTALVLGVYIGRTRSKH